MKCNFTFDHYRQLLSSALCAGYKFISYEVLLKNKKIPRKACLLRHDIDHDLNRALDIAKIENKSGIFSTYFVMTRSNSYNFWSFENFGLIQKILNLGHFLGLHFYSKESDFDELPKNAIIEAEILENIFNTKISTISIHHPSISKKFDFEIPGYINTYYKKQLKNFHYFSDTNKSWREGCPCSIFKNSTFDRIQLLIHPMWWSKNKDVSIFGSWAGVFNRNFSSLNKGLVKTERTVKEPFKVNVK